MKPTIKTSTKLCLALWLVLSAVGVGFTQWQQYYYANDLTNAPLEELYVKEVFCHRNKSTVKLQRKSDYAEYYTASVERDKCYSLQENKIFLMIYDPYMDEYLFPEELSLQKKEVLLAYVSLGLSLLCSGYQVWKLRNKFPTTT